MKRAFTLIELMIVIVIIGVVYALVISKIQTPQQKKELRSFYDLQGYLEQFRIKAGDSVALICHTNCQECQLKRNEESLKKVKLFTTTNPKRYTYEYFQGLHNVEDGNCFAFSIDGDGVNDQYIVEYKGKVFDFTNYFNAPKVYSSSDALSDAKATLIQVVAE